MSCDIFILTLILIKLMLLGISRGIDSQQKDLDKFAVFYRGGSRVSHIQSNLALPCHAEIVRSYAMRKCNFAHSQISMEMAALAARSLQLFSTTWPLASEALRPPHSNVLL